MRGSVLEETRIVETLVKSVEDVNAVCTGSIWYGGATPLFTATRRGYDSIVTTLLDADADPNARNASGNTSLCLAVYDEKVEITEILADRGADVNAVCTGSIWYGGATPLFTATRRGYDSIVTTLLDADADPNARNASGNTSLCLAVYDEKVEITEILADRGADVNAVCTGSIWYGGATPLFTATRRGYDSIVQILLDAGASP